MGMLARSHSYYRYKVGVVMKIILVLLVLMLAGCEVKPPPELPKVDKDGQVVFDFPASPSAIFDEDKNE